VYSMHSQFNFTNAVAGEEEQVIPADSAGALVSLWDIALPSLLATASPPLGMIPSFN
jgi:hypothetical protein